MKSQLQKILLSLEDGKTDVAKDLVANLLLDKIERPVCNHKAETVFEATGLDKSEALKIVDVILDRFGETGEGFCFSRLLEEACDVMRDMPPIHQAVILFNMGKSIGEARQSSQMMMEEILTSLTNEQKQEPGDKTQEKAEGISR